MSTWLEVSKNWGGYSAKHLETYPYTLFEKNDDGACCGEFRTESRTIKELTFQEAYAMYLGGAIGFSTLIEPFFQTVKNAAGGVVMPKQQLNESELYVETRNLKTKQSELLDKLVDSFVENAYTAKKINKLEYHQVMLHLENQREAAWKYNDMSDS